MDKNYKEVFPNNTLQVPRMLNVDFLRKNITFGLDVSLQDRLYQLGYDELRFNLQNMMPEKIIDDLASILDGEALKEKPKIIKYVKENIKDKDGKELTGEQLNKAVNREIDQFKAKLYNQKKNEAMDDLLKELQESSFFKKLIKMMG